MRITSKTSLGSNVSIRSNVYLRNEQSVGADPAFCSRVQGRPAIRLMLAQLGVSETNSAEVSRALTPRQFAEWGWEQRCEMCGCIPEGPVLINDHEEIQFRCPLGTCESLQMLSRAVLLDLTLVERATRRTKLDLSQVVQHALVEAGSSCDKTQASDVSSRRRFTIQLTPWQKYMLSDESIEAALRVFSNAITTTTTPKGLINARS